jgi:hypothetical protein
LGEEAQHVRKEISKIFQLKRSYMVRRIGKKLFL